VASRQISTMDIYKGAIPFVIIQVIMVAIVIAFPGIVTNNVSKVKDGISGTGADELRRQLAMPDEINGLPGIKQDIPSKNDEEPNARLLKMLKDQK
jgi:hypothetical protein